MMTDDPFTWEEREGELWVNLGGADDFMQFSGDEEFLTMITTRFERFT